MTDHRLPQWAPRVKKDLVSRLYASDAAGMLDADLVDEVGWALFHRCQSFLDATSAAAGAAPCPACGAIVSHHSGADEILTCAACGWSLPWKAYFATFQRQQLSGAEIIQAVFRAFTERFPVAAAPEEKMLQIDILIHEFHWNALHTPGPRACAVNLIEGRLHDVVQFLDRLSAGPSSTPGAAERRAAWRRVVNDSADHWKDDTLRVSGDE